MSLDNLALGPIMESIHRMSINERIIRDLNVEYHRVRWLIDIMKQYPDCSELYIPHANEVRENIGKILDFVKLIDIISKENRES